MHVFKTRFCPHSVRKRGTRMNRLRVAISAVTFISWCAPLSLAQTGCKPQEPADYVEGFAIIQQAGKVNVSLHLHCDSGRYGELVTPVGTYAVTDAYKAGKLRLTLVAGSDTVTMEAALEDGAVRGNLVADDGKGPPELRRTSDASTSSSAETLSLTKAQWHEDLSFLARELPKRHANAFHSVSRERFEAEVGELDQRLAVRGRSVFVVLLPRNDSSLCEHHEHAFER